MEKRLSRSDHLSAWETRSDTAEDPFSLSDVAADGSDVPQDSGDGQGLGVSVSKLLTVLELLFWRVCDRTCALNANRRGNCGALVVIGLACDLKASVLTRWGGGRGGGTYTS